MDSNDTAHRALLDALQTSFVDVNHVSDSGLRAQLLANNGTKVLTVLERELQSCDAFALSVAFINRGGVTPLLQTLKELEQRGIPGRILTTDYMSFSDPEVLKKLQSFSNIEVRFFKTQADSDRIGFHTKGYIFRQKDRCCVILGSSNLTQSALCLNREWNARLVGSACGEFSRQVDAEFESLWTHEHTYALEDAIDDYTALYERNNRIRKLLLSGQRDAPNGKELVPNAMQRELVDKVLHFMQMEAPEEQTLGNKRGLLISATGTGKTYASAFAVKALCPKRVLFLVHREQIARDALESYRAVMGSNKSYGIYIGQKQESDADIVFATMQTMVRHLTDFEPRTFDVIVVDEVHRAGAPSYQKIMGHFKPELWFGMTATPDRPDSFDIYGLFNHCILAEIRLQQAMASELLCPFHYFGISGLAISDKDYELEDFSRLAAPERVNHILEKAGYFGWSGRRVKGLVFCKKIEECRLLSKAFNARGLRTLALSGNDSVEARLEACERLGKDEGDNLLDYIFTVDIFNEGVDIPPVNQVILLRPTESPIVFVQQIGRGLRKYPGKEFVVILDFIGEYNHNFLIPIALSGNRSYNKDDMRRVVSTGTQVLSGVSSIHFDAVARERIFRSIDAARTNTLELLKNSYTLLRYQLGRIPSLMDFLDHGSIDPVKILDRCGSYYEFLKFTVKDQDFDITLDEQARAFLNYLTRRIANAQRPGEALVLEAILAGRQNLKADLVKTLAERYGFTATPEHLRSCAQILMCCFWTREQDRLNNAHLAVIEKNPKQSDEWQTTVRFKQTLEQNPALGNEIRDLVDFVLRRYKETYSGGYRNTMLKLYERYTYEDVCRMLNWSRNLNAQNIGGYFYDKESKTLPVFVNYEKSSEAIAYEDRFLSENHLVALSKTKRSVESADADHIFKRKPEDAGNHIYLFVRKNKDDKEAKSFYFLGEMDAEGDPIPVLLQGNAKAFEINYRLDVPVRDDIYSYLTQ